MSWPKNRRERHKIVKIALIIRPNSQLPCLILLDFSLRNSNTVAKSLPTIGRGGGRGGAGFPFKKGPTFSLNVAA